MATENPAAVRTTKNVDILLRREDLPRAGAAATAVALDYFEVAGSACFLERSDPNPPKAFTYCGPERKCIRSARCPPQPWTSGNNWNQGNTSSRWLAWFV